MRKYNGHAHVLSSRQLQRLFSKDGVLFIFFSSLIPQAGQEFQMEYESASTERS